jgi:HK97 family phage major capsid protein
MSQEDVTALTRSVEHLESVAVKRLDKQDERITDLAADVGDLRLARRDPILAGIYSAGFDSDIRSAMSRETAATIPEAARVVKGLPKDNDLSNAVTAAAAGRWFQLATLSQTRQRATKFDQHAKEFHKLTEALDDAGSEQKAALAEDADATGGYLVPTLIDANISRLITDAAMLWPQCRQVGLRTKTTQVPNVDSAVTVAWIEEAVTLSNTEPTFGQTTLTAEKLSARATMSLEVVQDSAPAVLQFLLSEFTRKMAGELDYQIVLGAGSSPQIVGIMNASGINAITSGTAGGRALTWDLLTAVFTQGSEASTRNDGVWLTSPTGLAELLQLSDSQSRPLILWGSGMDGVPLPSLLGRPIVTSARWGGSDTLDDTTNTATSIAFGPPGVVLAGTRLGMSWDVTDQVNWNRYQADARLVGRYAGNVGVPAAWTYLGQVDYS